MAENEEEKTLNFHEMGLDDRLLKAVASLGWAKPTLIQEKGIPLALQGKDILARARTGSGKTAAYAIPVIQQILLSKQTSREQCVKALVLTPTKELCNQAYANITSLCSSCSREVRCIDVSGQVALETHRPMLMEKPDIVVGTPSRILAHINAGNLNLKQSLEMLVIDEADLIFSFGYEDDVKAILGHLPHIYQSFLMSATLSEDVTSMKKMILHNPVTLKLEESQLPDSAQLTQYHIKCEEEDKFLLIYTLVKLGLLRGKSIMFVNSVDKGYRLKLFFEQFAIPSCVLNSEMPVNSRCHIVNQFNNGLYDIIIASDEIALANAKVPADTPDKKKDKKKENPRKKKRKRDGEAGVSRGIDFQFVSNVVNFDFPRDTDAYIHRVGRTARGDQQGTALSFVSMAEMARLEQVEETLADSHPEGESLFKPYSFRMEEIEGFRYRAKDAMRAVTRVAVREARLKEIKMELLNSHKLKSYFEDNPRDLQLLRHDKTLHTAKVQPHMKNVPDYIVPPTLRRGRGAGGGKPRTNQPRTSQHKYKQNTRTQSNYKKRQADPLKSFEFAGLSKRKRTK